MTLPVIPDLIAGESLASHRRRTRALNLLPTGPATQVLTADVGLDHCRAAGLEPERAEQASLERYAPSVLGRGRRRRAVARTWRLPMAATWSCANCTPVTGIVMRDWGLACHPVCLECEHLLTPTGSQRPTIPVGAAAVAWQHGVAETLEASVSSSSARALLARAYRYATLIALTMDEAWPPSGPGDEPALRTRVLAEGLHRSWDQRAPLDPAHAFVTAVPAFRAAATLHAGREVTRAGWERLDADPDLQHLRENPPAWLPAPPTPPPSPRPAATILTHRDLEGLRTRIRVLASFTPDQVPAMLLAPGERFLPRTSPVNDRQALAVALHHLTTTIHSPRADLAESAEAFGLSAAILRTQSLQDYASGVGLTGPDVDLLGLALDLLESEGLRDFQRLRRDLAPHLLTFSSTTRELARHVSSPPEHVLGAWAWTDLTLSPPPQATAALQLDLRRLDAALDPETRWHLRTIAVRVLEHSDLATMLEAETARGGMSAREWGAG